MVLKKCLLKTREFARMAQATRSTRAKPIQCAERIPITRFRKLMRTTSGRTPLLLARNALFREFLPSIPPPMRANQQDFALFHH